ncbi:MAG: hypothetical protein AAGA56_24955 [Myxococcota bacterium]
MAYLLNSYDEWKHCITVKCGIPLTSDYVDKRLAALSDEQDKATARFVELYGDAYRRQTIAWFEQARRELAA